MKSEVGHVEWRKLRHKARELFVSNDLDNIAESQKAKYLETRFELGAYLGHYEFIAVAIQNKTMDKKLYEAWNGTGYGIEWEKAKKYVCLRRSVDKKSSTGARSSRYEHFEKLGTEWSDKL